MSNRKIIASAAIAAGAFLWWRNANAENYSENLPVPDDTPNVGNEYGTIEYPVSLPDETVNDPMSNLSAFLYMLRSCEHSAADVASNADYTTFYGGSRFFNVGDHPVATGEKVGIPLPPEWCRKAGFASGNCVSTAAGAYQFTLPTWRSLRIAGAWGPYLPDFSPPSQDEAARRLLIQTGAITAIASGDIGRAIAIASATWASLPGSSAGQHPRSIEFATAKFNEGLQA